MEGTGLAVGNRQLFVRSKISNFVVDFPLPVRFPSILRWREPDWQWEIDNFLSVQDFKFCCRFPTASPVPFDSEMDGTGLAVGNRQLFVRSRFQFLLSISHCQSGSLRF